MYCNMLIYITKYFSEMSKLTFLVSVHVHHELFHFVFLHDIAHLCQCSKSLSPFLIVAFYYPFINL